MKLRILQYRTSATHDLFSSLQYLTDPICISDFDAFVYNPIDMNAGGDSNVWSKRAREMRDLLRNKGGIVVSFLRPDTATDPLLEGAMGKGVGQTLQGNVIFGTGSQIRVKSSPTAVSGGYFQVLNKKIIFTAYLSMSEEELDKVLGKVLAVDSVGHPVAVEFSIGQGKFCFLTPPDGIPSDRLGAAILRVITAHYQKDSSRIEAPTWAARINVPGSNIYDEQIAELEKKRDEANALIDSLITDRNKILRYVDLLFGYGKGVLEPAVRSALRLAGFSVSEPEQYSGEWDVEMKDPISGLTALGEVEGSEGQIDVDKYRQLNDYVDSEALEGRNHKGILIGNGYRLLPPEAAEKFDQFTDHAKRGASKNRFCLLPTSELFKAVCAILESPNNETLKASIRKSILEVVGPWAFIKETPPENQQPTATDANSSASPD